MNQRLRLILSIALLLSEPTSHCYVTAAATLNTITTNVVADKMPAAPQNKRDHLLTIMIEDYLQLSDYELEQSKALVQKVLADEQMATMRSDLMAAEKRIMENYVRQVTNKEEEEPPAKSNIANRFFYLIAKSLIYQEFEAILRRHNTTNTQRKFSPENYAIEQLLKKHGLDKVERELQQKQSQFMNDFVREVETHLAGLTAAQRAEADGEPQKMLEWLGRMRRETDVQQRMEIFKDFMRFFVKF